MSETCKGVVERRKFLRTMTVATSAAGLAPRLYATLASAAASANDDETTHGGKANELHATGRVCRGPALRGNSQGGATARQGLHRRHGRGDSFWRAIPVEQDDHRPGPWARARATYSAPERACPPLPPPLAHGAMTHAFEQDNLTFPDSGAHPGAALVASGLAVSQERGSSGREFLTAFVAGAEVMIRIGRATKRTNEARRLSCAGDFESLRRGGGQREVDAIRRAEDEKRARHRRLNTRAAFWNFPRSGDGAMVKRLHLGRAAESGVLAASLAADGFDGPSTVLEGGAGFLKAFCNQSDPAELTRELGEKYLTQTIPG